MGVSSRASALHAADQNAPKMLVLQATDNPRWVCERYNIGRWVRVAGSAMGQGCIVAAPLAPSDMSRLHEVAQTWARTWIWPATIKRGGKPLTVAELANDRNPPVIRQRLNHPRRNRAVKIEAGKKYRTREGKIRGPLKVTKSHPDRFTDEQGNWYGDDGHYWRQYNWKDCPFALVEEVS